MTDDRRSDRRPVSGSAAPPRPGSPPPGPRNLPPGWSPVPPGDRDDQTVPNSAASSPAPPAPGRHGQPNGQASNGRGPGGQGAHGQGSSGPGQAQRRAPNGQPPNGQPPNGQPPNGQGRHGQSAGRHGAPAAGRTPPAPAATRVGAPDTRADERADAWSTERPEPRLLTHEGARPLATAAAGTAAPSRAAGATRVGGRPGTAPTVATDVVQGTAAPGRTRPTDDPPEGPGRRGGGGSDDEPPSRRQAKLAALSPRQRRRRRARRIAYVVLGLAILGPVQAFAIGWIVFRIPSADDAT
ncbi:MAG: hypothetical protein QOE59_5306, partial [Actinomycetota bacterium]|nr:hypothetical protein [Actinomycetota bacterium]